MDGSKAMVEATIFQPGGTMTLSKMPEVDPVFLELLCQVFENFLEKFLEGASVEEVLAWSGRIKSKAIPTKTAISSCTLCSYETKNKVALKKHYTIVHTQDVAPGKCTSFQCLECNKYFKSSLNLANHAKKCHNIQGKTVQLLQKRVYELEQLVSKLQEKEPAKVVPETKSGDVSLCQCHWPAI